MKEYSAARLEYSMLLMPEVISSTERKLPELRELAVQSGIDFAGSTPVSYTHLYFDMVG